MEEILLTHHVEPNCPNKRVRKLMTNIGWFTNPSVQYTPSEILLRKGDMQKAYSLSKIGDTIAFYKETMKADKSAEELYQKRNHNDLL